MSESITENIINLDNLTPSSRREHRENKIPLIRPAPSIFEYIMTNLQVIIIISLFVLMVLCVFYGNIFNYILGSSIPKTSVGQKT